VGIEHGTEIEFGEIGTVFGFRGGETEFVMEGECKGGLVIIGEEI